jgi:hypothetical protein
VGLRRHPVACGEEGKETIYKYPPALDKLNYLSIIARAKQFSWEKAADDLMCSIMKTCDAVPEQCG